MDKTQSDLLKQLWDESCKAASEYTEAAEQHYSAQTFTESFENGQGRLAWQRVVRTRNRYAAYRESLQNRNIDVAMPKVQ